jgi:putative ABC transport system permease protein
VGELDPTLPLFDVATMPARIGASLAPARLALAALASFAALALLLAMLGVYGVVHYSTAQRTREMGIRLALGARPRDLVRLVVRQGVGLALAGIAAGVVAALSAGRALGGLLYGVEHSDPTSFAAGAGLLVLAAAAASYLPGRRAARVDPALSIRAE